MDEVGNVGDEADLVVEADGTVHIAHVDRSAEDLRLSTLAPGSGWSNVTLDAMGSVGFAPRLATDPSGGLHLVYYDNGPDDLRYLFRPAGAAFASPATVLTTGSVGRRSGLAVDAAGGVHVVAWRQSVDDLEYAFRPAGGLWSPETVIEADRVQEYADVAVDAAGDVWAVTFDATPEVVGTSAVPRLDLRLAHRPAGGSWTVSTLDAVGDVGRWPAIATTPDGWVHVVYFENGADDLRHLRWCPEAGR